MTRRAIVLLGAVLLAAARAGAQELDARTYSPAPIGTTVLVSGFGRSEGGIVLDPSLGIDDAQADLWFTMSGAGYYFDLGGRQARVLALFPTAWGEVTAEAGNQSQRQDLRGLVDPRFKLSVGLLGSPALTRNRLERAPRRTAVGTTLTIVAPLGQYDSGQLVNLGYNRWAFKPEIGITQPAGGFVLECYAGSWLFTTNHEYFPGRAQRRQEPIVSVQGHIGYSLASRAWLALDGTWFEGGTTEVDGRSSPDRQDNVRLGGTLSVSVMKGHSIKLIYSSGAHTLRGTDYDTFTLTWQIVRLGT